MKFLTITILCLIFIFTKCKSWEYCQSEVHSSICGDDTHFVCNAEMSIPETSWASKEFLAHVPITRKIKKAFLNWHNYYRNLTAGGVVGNKKNKKFPTAVRMRVLIWDEELSFLSHVRTKLVNSGEPHCTSTQRFLYAGQSLEVTAFNDTKPILEIIFLALRTMFDTKNTIEHAYDMPKEFTTDHLKAKAFTIMINDRVSRVGCAISLGTICTNNKGEWFLYCYYTACTYDYGVGGVIYKIGPPTGRCFGRWKVRPNPIYKNLCDNKGEIFDYAEASVTRRLKFWKW